jgi:hypothetical protein
MRKSLLALLLMSGIVFSSCDNTEKKTNDDPPVVTIDTTPVPTFTGNDQMVLDESMLRGPKKPTGPRKPPYVPPTPIPVDPTTPTPPTYTSKNVVFVDFDGATVPAGYWGATAFDVAPSGFTQEQIDATLTHARLIYNAYNIQFTTDEVYWNASDPASRGWCIVTPTSAWKPGVGGIAYTNSFWWGDAKATPYFVFSDRLGNNTKYVAECVGHETGHVVGLGHKSVFDAACTLIATYKTGPLLGNSYASQPCGYMEKSVGNTCNVIQDDHTIVLGKLGPRL